MARSIVAAICFVIAAGCAVGMPARTGDAAPADAIVYGRVLSVPGMASPMMPAPSGVADVKVSVADAASGTVITTARTGSDGSFRFVVAPGDYSIRGAGNPHLVHLDAGQQLEVNLYLPNP
jgi:hypothetical protein